MIKLKLLLKEVHQEDLFHATQSDKLLKILKDDAIKLGFAGGTTADQQLNKGYHFFLSTMRVKYGNFALGSLPDPYVSYNVIIHLDGKKLTNAGFKVFPVDFWGMGPKNSEQEERIVSDKDEIKPLSNFVKDVHVYVDTSSNNPHSLERLHEINNFAKKSSFPIYFYLTGNERHFKSHRTDKAIRNLDTMLAQPKWSESDLDHKKWLAKNNPEERIERYSKRLRIFLDIYYGKPVDTDTYPGNSVMKWLLYYPHDAHSQISTDIHNIKQDHPPIFREFVEIMKKEGFKTVKEFVDFMIKRERSKEDDRRNKESEQYKKDMKWGKK